MGRKHRHHHGHHHGHHYESGRALGQPQTRSTGDDTPAAPRALGIDIGRVIIKPGDTAGDTSFLHGTDADAMRTPPNRGALETIAQLVTALQGRVWLVSKCGPRIQARTRRWLAHHRFFERTGVRPDRLRFCLKRHEKAPICARLRLDAFIDDRPDVLRPMEGVVPWRYLFGPQRRGVRAGMSDGMFGGMIAVADWDAVATHLLPQADEPAVMPAECPRSAAAPGR
ncbi:MAG: hypothetical protein AAGF11_16230 [Myxococcota bacterium]